MWTILDLVKCILFCLPITIYKMKDTILRQISLQILQIKEWKRIVWSNETNLFDQTDIFYICIKKGVTYNQEDTVLFDKRILLSGFFSLSGTETSEKVEGIMKNNVRMFLKEYVKQSTRIFEMCRRFILHHVNESKHVLFLLNEYLQVTKDNDTDCFSESPYLNRRENYWI